MERTHYSIAEEFASENPGQSHASTHKRIYRKLRKGPHDRLWHALIVAYGKSRKSHPYATCIRALQELSEHDDDTLWAWKLEQARCDFIDYKAKTGSPPPANMTLGEIEEVARKPLKGTTGFMGSMSSDYALRSGGLLPLPKKSRDEEK